MRVIHEQGNFRIVEIIESHADLDDLKGQSFDPSVNPEIPTEQLKQEEREFEDLVSREGVFGYVLERWNPEVGAGWEHVDSCFGFVGQYSEHEEIFNHYIVSEFKQQIESERA